MKFKNILTRATSLLLSSVFALSISSCGIDSPSYSSHSRSTESLHTTESTDKPLSSSSTSENVSKPQEVLKYDIVSQSFSKRTTSLGTVYMECCIVIENTGTKNIYIHGTDLDIEDSSGSLFDTVSDINAYPNVIAPGEKSVIYDTFSLDEGYVDENYVVKPSFDIEIATVPIERLEVSDFSLKEDKYGYIKAVGRVKNTTDEKQSLYNLVVVLYDADGKILSLFYTYPDRLEPGQTTSFSFSNMTNYGKVNYSDIAGYDVFAFTFQYQF